ncbi:unnamed protein product, partial [Prunus brigantina]
MPLGPMHTTLLDPRSQADLNSWVDQLTQKVDDQNNLIGQLLRQINLDQGPNLGPRDEEEGARACWQVVREGRERDSADETQAAASHTLSCSRLGPRTNVFERLGPQSNVHAHLGPQGARDRERSLMLEAPKRFTTPSITRFKGDSDPESHLRHFKSAMILYKADDALMCKVFTMTLRGAAQD